MMFAKNDIGPGRDVFTTKHTIINAEHMLDQETDKVDKRNNAAPP